MAEDKQGRTVPKLESRRRNDKREHPMSAFRRLLKDFQAGIQALGRVPPASPQADVKNTRVVHTSTVNHYTKEVKEKVYEKAKESARSVTNENPNVTPQLSTLSGRKRSSAAFHQNAQRHSNAVLQQAAVDRTIRVPVYAPASDAPMARAELTPGDFRNMPIVGGAEREALLRFSAAHPSDSPYRVPSAARLLQITRAAELMEAGELPRNARVEHLAKQIRAGNKRAVADMNPAAVQRVLHSAVGGNQAASKLLNTPEVNRLIERHETTLRTLERGIADTRKNVGKIRTNSENRPGQTLREKIPATQGALETHYNNDTLRTSTATSVHAPVAEGNRTHQQVVNNLTHMLATNEEPHDRAMAASITAAEESGKARAVPSELRAFARSGSSVLGRPIASERETASSITAAPKKAVKEIEKPAETKKSGGRQEITGTLELMMNGQKSGEARFKGEMR